MKWHPAPKVHSLWNLVSVVTIDLAAIIIIITTIIIIIIIIIPELLQPSVAPAGCSDQNPWVHHLNRFLGF